MTGAGDVQDTPGRGAAGRRACSGRFPVTNTLPDVPFDEAGTASVSVTVPDGVGDGRIELTLRGTRPAPR